MLVPNDVSNACLYEGLYDDNLFDNYQAKENIFDFNKSLRSIKYNKYIRTNWQDHRNELILTYTFYSKMLMDDVSAFEHLVTLLCSDITVNKLWSQRFTGGVDPIYPEMMVATGLQSEKLKSLSDIYHYSLDSGRRVAENFVDAVLKYEKLAINLPTTDAQLLMGLAKGFSDASGAYGFLDPSNFGILEIKLINYFNRASTRMQFLIDAILCTHTFIILQDDTDFKDVTSYLACSQLLKLWPITITVIAIVVSKQQFGRPKWPF